MRNTQKFALVCICMIGTGILLTGAGYAMGGRVYGITVGGGGLNVNTPNVRGESSYDYIEETRELEEFTDMEINVDFCDVTIEPSDHFGISYCVDSRSQFSAEVADGRLTVTQKIKGGNFVFFGTGISDMWKESYVKIYVSENAALGSVTLNNGSGDVTGSGFAAEKLELNADFGSSELKNIRCNTAGIFMGNGKMDLSDFSGGTLTVEDDFGDACLNRVNADCIEIAMGNGKLESKELRGETLDISQEFGDIDLEDVKITGKAVIANGNGACDFIKTDLDDLTVTSEFGDVKIELTDSVSNYALKLNTEFGKVKINQEDMGDTYKSWEEKDKKITVDCGNGDITVISEI